MAPSSNRWVPEVVDLTLDSDGDVENDGNGHFKSAEVASKAPKSPLRRPAQGWEVSASKARTPTTASTPLPGSKAGDGAVHHTNLTWTSPRTPRMGPSATSRKTSTVTAPATMWRNSNGFVMIQSEVAGSAKRPKDTERSAKKIKVTAPNRQDVGGMANQARPSTQSSGIQRTKQNDATAGSANGMRAASHDIILPAKLTTIHGAPTVHYMNSALKPSGSSSTSSFLDRFSASAARPLLFDNLPQDDPAIGLPSPGLTTPESVAATVADADALGDDMMEIVQPSPHTRQAPVVARVQQSPLPFLPRSDLPAMASGDADSVMSDLPGRQQPPKKAQHTSKPAQVRLSATLPAAALPHPQINMTSGSATDKVDHFLIFLKEVKKLKWADITKEFGKDISGYTYTKLQSRYSAVVNKRDRTQDPPTLSLPARFAAEATIDWVSVHANTEGHKAPRARNEATKMYTSGASRSAVAGRPLIVSQNRDDESSGTDSAPQRQSKRRAAPVNYTWPKLRSAQGGFEEWIDGEEPNSSHFPDAATTLRSESPTEGTLITPDMKTATKLEPLDVNFHSQDARFGLGKSASDSKQEQLPYLSSTQHLAMQGRTQEPGWESQSMQDWQGAVLHVDFSPAELQIVDKCLTKILPSAPRSRHSTYRRYLRAVLKDLPSPKLQKLAYEVRRHISSRNGQSVAAFLEDAATGKMSDVPRIQRLATIKQSENFNTIQSSSVSSIIRNRELGLQSRRGWQAASKSTTYQLRNQLMDTLGPKSTWTGASSDIHTVAWSPDGQCFAAGAVAVTDTDSMQYNRPNVLMYGDTADNSIYELGRHCVARPKTEAGANSTHAMYASQDSKLYTTVSSVAFSPSGDLMYSAGYDRSVCIWDVTAGSRQPELARQLEHRAPVDILAVNPNYDGNIATATKRTTGKSIKLVKFDEETVQDEDWAWDVVNFASAKAMNRPDLNMSANALKFDPTGRHLLAGFGANMREDSGLDTSGDICLWDVETQQALQVHGSSRNVFDVSFDPFRRDSAIFAVGCVANGSVNRGTRSVVRFYSTKVNSSHKYSCSLELECRAFDMNDVVWCPYDENLVAAGCTDGRSYIWDLRKTNSVLHTMKHGKSLMPLQDGVAHERTDTGVRFLSWGQNARRLYTGSSDGVLKVWDVTQADEDVFIKDLTTTNSGIMSGAFTTDYSKLVIGEVNGTANVLEVGRDDIVLKDADILRYHAYVGKPEEDEIIADTITDGPSLIYTDTAATEARTWLSTGQLQLAPMGGLPKQQVIQGSNYQGPFDRAEDAHSLREQAFIFQRDMAKSHGPQCKLPHCADSINVITHEEVGDSGRSKYRIPNDLRRQWLDETPRTVPGKSKCAECGRPAIPSTDSDTEAFCERCSFACSRCGTEHLMVGSCRTFDCAFCGGVWDVGALGYECIQEPHRVHFPKGTPQLKSYEKESYLERLEDLDTTFGDEMNALTDHYFGLALDRPESPPL